MLSVADSNDNVIKISNFEIPTWKFLLMAGGLALFVFLILLSILLIMYLRKRMTIKAYLSLEEKDYQVQDKILAIEHEISKIQHKFYANRQYKVTKKYFLNH